MANTIQSDQAASVAGLGTSSFTIVTAGEYTASCRSTIPRDPGSQLNSAQTSPYASALQIVINQNGTPKITVGGSSTNPTPSQPSLAATTRILCAAGDVITFVLTSANAIDNQPNAVKSLINLYAGI